VAMTRARQGLLVSGVKGRASKESKEGANTEIAGSWYVRLAAAGVGEEVDAYPAATARADADVAAAADERVRYTDFRERFRDATVSISAEEAAMAGLDDDDEDDDGIVFDAAAARHGELVHALLERITRYPQAFGSVPDAETVLRWFPASGAGAPGAREQWQEQIVLAVSEAATMLKAPALRPLLFPGEAISARNEVELYDARGRLLRIDRLVEFEDRVVIVDYKLRLLPQEHAAYGAQLARYVAAITPMFPGKRIEAGVATAEGEWIDASALRPVVQGEQGSLF